MSETAAQAFPWLAIFAAQLEESLTAHGVLTSKTIAIPFPDDTVVFCGKSLQESKSIFPEFYFSACGCVGVDEGYNRVYHQKGNARCRQTIAP